MAITMAQALNTALRDAMTADGTVELFTRRQERVSAQFPDVVTLLGSGLHPREAIVEGEIVAWKVKEGDKVFSDPGGAEGLAVVPAGQEEATIEAAEECPGECIFIEVE